MIWRIFFFTECDFLLFLFFVLTYPEHDTFISNQKSGMMFKNAFKFSKGMGWEWCWKRIINNSLEALPVDNGRTGFIIFLFGDPHLLESGQWCQDRSSNPYWVFPFGRSNDLNFHGRWANAVISFCIRSANGIFQNDWKRKSKIFFIRGNTKSISN